MQPKLKSFLITGSLSVLLLLLILSILMVFVSGPLEKQRRDRVEAFKRVRMDYKIINPIYLNASNYDRVCIMGEGEYEGVKVYFASDPLGRVLDRISKDKVDIKAALAFASKTMKFDQPSVRIAYFNGEFVVAIIEKKRETLVDGSTYTVLLTVETGV